MSDKLTIFRIVKTKWKNKAFDGEGAKTFGGRWNSRGSACVYCASTESLAQLEMLVHLQKSSLIKQYTLLEARLDKSQITTFSAISPLPENWQEYPAPQETAEIGDKWLSENKSVALEIPSVVVPREVNYLLNPLHQDFPDIVENAIAHDLQFDPRLV